jgi:hypothetical protein
MFRFTGMGVQYIVETGQDYYRIRAAWGRARRAAGGGCAMRVIARELEHYEVHEVPYGKVYSWRPERIVFECDCGETLVWEKPVTVCACGAAHTDVSPEERRMDQEHPWQEDYEEWRREKEANNLRHEYFDFVGPGDD